MTEYQAGIGGGGQQLDPLQHRILTLEAKNEQLRAALERLHDWASASNDWRPDSRLGRIVIAALES